MSRILVAGVVNVETTVLVDGFPVEYSPVRYPFFGIRSAPSGAGYNLSCALSALGDSVSFLSLVGPDLAGQMTRTSLAERGIAPTFVLLELAETAQSVVLYDAAGRRQVNTDLKDVQKHSYPIAQFDALVAGCALAVLTNVNFSRPLLERAHAAGVPIASDVHAISSLDDLYNGDFMQHAHILFMSHERLPLAPVLWAAAILERCAAAVVVIGMGATGALLAVRGQQPELIPAVPTRSVVSTVGAGDALFACFLHFYAAGARPRDALLKAMVFASYKIGAAGGAEGFLNASELDRLCAIL